MSAAPVTAGAMKAVLTQERFSDPDWIFERKLDGIRCIAIRDGGPVKLLSRNDLSLNARFPGVAEALDAQSLLALRDRRRGRRLRATGRRASSGSATRAPRSSTTSSTSSGSTARTCGPAPLRERKALLRDALSFDEGPIRLTPHRNEAGEAMFEEACRKGWEGVIAKRADSVYTGSRSRDWLKFKCDQGQELVIGGFTAPRGSREEFGALLVGVYDSDGALLYAGKVGTGFDRATLKDLGAKLRELERDTAPFVDAPRYRDATWVEPELVAQLGFAEWTTAGRLRHPRFLGLRDDKAARSVVRES